MDNLSSYQWIMIVIAIISTTFSYLGYRQLKHHLKSIDNSAKEAVEVTKKDK